MISKHGPYKEDCVHSGACQRCAHGVQYERMAHKLNDQHAVKNRHHIHGYDLESAQTANRIADLKMAAAKARRRKKAP